MEVFRIGCLIATIWEDELICLRLAISLNGVNMVLAIVLGEARGRSRKEDLDQDWSKQCGGRRRLESKSLLFPFLQ